MERLDNVSGDNDTLRARYGPGGTLDALKTKKVILARHAAGLWDGSPEQWARCVWGDTRIPFVLAQSYEDLPNKAVRSRLHELVTKGTIDYVVRLVVPSQRDALGLLCYDVDCR